MRTGSAKVTLEVERKIFLLQLVAWRLLESTRKVISTRERISTISRSNLSFSRLYDRMTKIAVRFPFMEVNPALADILSASDLTHLFDSSKQVFRQKVEFKVLEDMFAGPLELMGGTSKNCRDLLFRLAPKLRDQNVIVLNSDNNELLAMDAAMRARHVSIWQENSRLINLMGFLLGKEIWVPSDFTVDWSEEKEKRFRCLITDVTSDPDYYDSVWSAFESIKASTKFVLVPNTFLTHSYREDPILKMDILLSEELRAVINLPDWVTGARKPKSSLLVFDRKYRRPDILLIDVSRESLANLQHIDEGASVQLLVDKIEESLEGRIRSSNVFRLTPETCRDNNYNLAIEHYRQIKDEASYITFLRSVNTKSLGEIVEFCRPQSVHDFKLVGQGKRFREAAISDIGENGLLRFPAKEVELSIFAFRTPDRSTKGHYIGDRCFLLKQNDILLAVKGSVGRVALVPAEDSKTWFANQSFVILRLKENTGILSPAVLFQYLASTIGQSEIAGRVSMNDVPYLKLHDLERIRVPIPSQQNQEKIEYQFQKSLEVFAQIELLRKKAIQVAGNFYELLR